MRWRGIVGVAASSLAVAVAGAGSAVAQTPVKPAEDTPKAEQPKPEQPKPEQPKPAEQEPKAPAPEPAKAEPAKPEPKAETPKPEKPKPAQKQPAEPKPAKPKPAKQEPVRAEAGAPSAQAPAPAPAPAPAAVVAKTSSPRPARSVDASRVRHVNAAASAPKRRHRAARDPGGSAGVERSHVRAAADVERPDPVPMRHSADATPATTRAWAAPPMHGSRPEPVAASVERRQPRMLPLNSSQTASDVTLLLAIAFTTGIALLLGRHARRELW